MAILLAVPQRAYAAGTTVLGPVPVPLNATHALVRFTRVAWPDAPQALSMDVEITQDGLTWQFLGGMTAAGGSPINSDTGLPFAESWLELVAPQPTNPLRQVRATAVLSVPLTTAITVEVT